MRFRCSFHPYVQLRCSRTGYVQNAGRDSRFRQSTPSSDTCKRRRQRVGAFLSSFIDRGATWEMVELLWGNEALFHGDVQ